MLKISSSPLYFTLKNKISKGTSISLKNDNEEDIVEFEADEEFKTLIISNEKITKGTYYLYENDEKTEYTSEVK